MGVHGSIFPVQGKPVSANIAQAIRWNVTQGRASGEMRLETMLLAYVHRQREPFLRPIQLWAILQRWWNIRRTPQR